MVILGQGKRIGLGGVLCHCATRHLALCWFPAYTCPCGVQVLLGERNSVFLIQLQTVFYVLVFVLLYFTARHYALVRPPGRWGRVYGLAVQLLWVPRVYLSFLCTGFAGGEDFGTPLLAADGMLPLPSLCYCTS